MKRLCDKCNKMLVWTPQDGLHCLKHGYNFREILEDDLTTKKETRKNDLKWIYRGWKIDNIIILLVGGILTVITMGVI